MTGAARQTTVVAAAGRGRTERRQHVVAVQPQVVGPRGGRVAVSEFGLLVASRRRAQLGVGTKHLDASLTIYVPLLELALPGGPNGRRGSTTMRVARGRRPRPEEGLQRRRRPLPRRPTRPSRRPVFSLV